MNPEPTSRSSAIRTVLWDVGDVLYDVDLDRSRRRWTDTTGLDGEHFDRAFFHSGIWSRLELGQMTPEEAVPAINAVYGTAVAPQQFYRIWNDAISPRPAQIGLVASTSRLVACGVISNTDPIHAATMQQNQDLMRVIQSWTFSFEVGVEKPDPSIYWTALQRMQAEPAHVLLVDDKLVNVQAARGLGMDAVLCSDLASLVRELEARGLIGR
ncbi:MAG: HAD family phosphatase [Bradymonadales bacterium]|nr:HAD family phosphatase [Bradymonadales bacterium]